MTADPQIPGYGFGSPETARSPLSSEDLLHLEQTLGWSADDERLLREHAGLFRRKAEQMVDSWRAVIGAQPHLAQWFFAPDGKPDEEYKARVRRRFVQWVVDVAARPPAPAGGGYQGGLGRRQTPGKKATTDARHTPPLAPLRYLLGFVPVVIAIRPFLEDAISNPEELAAIERAWAKAVHLHVTLWARPYTRDGLW